MPLQWTLNKACSPCSEPLRMGLRQHFLQRKSLSMRRTSQCSEHRPDGSSCVLWRVHCIRQLCAHYFFKHAHAHARPGKKNEHAQSSTPVVRKCSFLSSQQRGAASVNFPESFCTPHGVSCCETGERIASRPFINKTILQPDRLWKDPQYMHLGSI